MRIRRREFVQGLGAAAATTGLGCRGRGDGDTAGGPGSIEHVILVMMENRSFDHALGALRLEGRTDIDGLDATMSNPHPDGGTVSVFPTDVRCVADPPHGWDSSRVQFADGANSGFVQAYWDRYGSTVDVAEAMGYLTRDTQPISHAFADHYAVCNRWFSSVLTSTWPNRLYSHGAQSQGQKTNDPPEGGTFTMRTIWDQLDDAGVAWGYYYSDLPFMGVFGRFGERLEFIDRFFDHCADGTLPPVCMVEPAFSYNDDHPPHHPLLGQLFLASIHDALAASPLWNKCLIVVYYDEAGGFFDHVPPPTAADDRADEGFDQLGFRIPAMVLGPWVRAGHASDVVFDHTSPLAHIQGMFGLEALTARDAAASDLWPLIDEDRLAAGTPLAPAALPVITLTEDEIAAECRSAARRGTGQRELQAALARLGYGHLDRTADLERTVRRWLAHAERLGSCRIVR